jgi:uncharacterized protein
MRIENLIWEGDGNVLHIARHNVTPEEVEEVCFGTYIYRREFPQKYVLSGQSSSGRYLNVVIERIGKGSYRPVTAFEMNEGDKRTYRKRMGK